ncbi:hypothetical protein EYR40_010829 [Pleurotus pulmonarius]|nr:hypothetical protein EYR36_002600 [Pleurotus pulmonarius]KAF4586813.1 hypothetical protein EYR40_010829 [Pleurotus pulmonarius]
MGVPSEHASNAIIYTTYSVFLLFGLAVGIKFARSKSDFLASLRTQSALPLALNFATSGLGSGILFTYPEIGNIAGVQGVLTYAIASSLPIMTFPFLASRIRKACPHGFVLTEYVRERFGVVASLFLSIFSVLTMFLYMCSELTSVSLVINSLTGLDGLPATIVEVVVTILYTAVGGLRTSLITDNIQGVMIILLMIICTIAVGVNVHIDKGAIPDSGLTHATKLGWQLLYILPVAIVFNNYFLSGYWQRAFSSKTDKDLFWGCFGATIFIFVILTLVGFSGILANWAGLIDPEVEGAGSASFFILLSTLPTWVVGFCIVFALTMSCAAYDTLQVAIVATLSNDVFRNKINMWWVRIILVVNIPAVVVATKGLNILVLFLIADLVSAALLPPILLGLVPSLYFLNGFDVVVGGLGGFLTVFFFGLVYYDGNAAAAGGLLILEKGLYANDWSAFGAFVAAPVGSMLWTAGAFGLRCAYYMLRSKRTGEPFRVFERREIDRARFADAATRAGIFIPDDFNDAGSAGSGVAISEGDRKSPDMGASDDVKRPEDLAA